MIDHIWTVLCLRAVIDVDSQNVSIQNVLEELNLTVESGVRSSSSASPMRSFRLGPVGS